MDALRAAAIIGVIFGHWLVTAVVSDPHYPAALHIESPLAHLPGLTPVTWLTGIDSDRGLPVSGSHRWTPCREHQVYRVANWVPVKARSYSPATLASTAGSEAAIEAGSCAAWGRCDHRVRREIPKSKYAVTIRPGIDLNRTSATPEPRRQRALLVGLGLRGA